MDNARPLTLLLLLLALTTCPAHAAVNCQAIERVASLEAKRLAEAPSAQRATGSDKMQFYKAPHGDCTLPGIFILPGEAVAAQKTYQGFTWVTYTNPESQKQTSGWVQSDRLAP